MRRPPSHTSATLHLRVALLECDSAVTLEETLLLLQDPSLHLKRVGERAVAFPASELEQVRRALELRQCYPRVVGGAMPAPSPEEEP